MIKNIMPRRWGSFQIEYDLNVGNSNMIDANNFRLSFETSLNFILRHL